MLNLALRLDVESKALTAFFAEFAGDARSDFLDDDAEEEIR